MNTLFVPYVHEEVHLEGFLAYPSSEKKPLVILCHAWKGRDEFICEKAKKLAALGYAGFALDVYGKGIIGKSKEENAALKKPLIEDRNLLQQRLLKGFTTACALPYVDASQVVVLGFGFGGICALDLARSGIELKGAISVYGHFDQPPESIMKPITTNILILHGYNDPISTMRELHDFQTELDKAKVNWQTHVYGNTYHAFATPGSNDLASGILYNPFAAEHAWGEIEKFLAYNLS